MGSSRLYIYTLTFRQGNIMLNFQPRPNLPLNQSFHKDNLGNRMKTTLTWTGWIHAERVKLLLSLSTEQGSQSCCFRPIQRDQTPHRSPGNGSSSPPLMVHWAELLVVFKDSLITVTITALTQRVTAALWDLQPGMQLKFCQEPSLCWLHWLEDSAQPTMLSQLLGSHDQEWH